VLLERPGQVEVWNLVIRHRVVCLVKIPVHLDEAVVLIEHSGSILADGATDAQEIGLEVIVFDKVSVRWLSDPTGYKIIPMVGVQSQQSANDRCIGLDPRSHVGTHSHVLEDFLSQLLRQMLKQRHGDALTRDKQDGLDLLKACERRKEGQR